VPALLGQRGLFLIASDQLKHRLRFDAIYLLPPISTARWITRGLRSTIASPKRMYSNRLSIRPVILPQPVQLL
jgi:hypothetical protein